MVTFLLHCYTCSLRKKSPEGSRWLRWLLGSYVLGPLRHAASPQGDQMRVKRQGVVCTWAMGCHGEKMDPSGKLTITNIAMGNHHFQWENQLFLWPFSIVIVCLPEGIGFYRYLYTTASTVKLCQIDRIMSVVFSPKVHFFS